MRIGIDYTAAARQGAGIGRYTRELVSALLALTDEDGAQWASQHEVTLFAATGGLAGEAWRPKADADIRLRRLPLSDEWLARLWHRLRLPLPVEIITGPIDIFYSPDFVLPPTRRRARSLLTVHDLSFLHHPDHFVPRLVHYLSDVVPRSVARADLVLADSEATRQDLIRHMGADEEHVRVLYSGVDERFQPNGQADEEERVRSRYGLGSKPYILSVGTLQPRKNYVRLIDAFEALPNDLRDETTLAIAGGRGWLYDEILARSATSSGNVQLLGFAADEDLPALYRSAEAFIFPSIYEGFGLPVLEAMACGVPVVCSNASSLPEVAGDAALMVDPFDVPALSKAMARALDDSALRQTMTARGLKQASRFTWAGAAGQLVGVFGELT